MSATACATFDPRLEDIKIVSYEVRDVRWPTSLDRIGTDALNSAGEDAHARVYYKTNLPDVVGVGWSFANGQGTEVICACIHALAPRFVGRCLYSLIVDFAQTHRDFIHGQTRFMSPERGVLQLAQCACLNAIWDLWAKVLHKPLWKLIVDMTPEELVSVVPFKYIEDAITKEEAIELLRGVEAGTKERENMALLNKAIIGYSTSVGGLGTSDEEIEELVKHALSQGFNRFKLRLGLGVERDRQRISLIRRLVGPAADILTDANEQWGVNEAIPYMLQLADLKPTFIEEPTSPDDVLGHKAVHDALLPHGIKIATGEHVNNRVLFKQFLQAGAIDFLQLDAVRLSGINEILAVCLMAAKFDVPVVPHSGGVGMVEICSHVATAHYVKISGKQSMMEYTKHLHDCFLEPAGIAKGYHITPLQPGASSDLHEWVYTKYECPDGEFWRSEKGKQMLGDPWRGVARYQTS